MQWNAIPTQEPPIVFPVGAIVEDDYAVYKILSEVEVQRFAHKYKVEVLTQKTPLPAHFKYFIDPKFQTLVVLPQNIDKIQRIA